jgi:4-diphosphocytidyl-2-C-methyl-D-erythritol kinase
MQYDKKAITVQAPAKLNLTLSITGRRADGYHLLDSFFVFCGLHDVITIKADDELLLDEVSGPFAVMMGSLNDNLVIRAAKLLRTQANIKAGARIALIKNIPVAAGLGGGSADAAATLNALNQFWKLDWSPARLEALATQLGADVPACIQSKSVTAQGIGDILHTAPAIPQLGLLLVNPLIPTSTPQVFKVYTSANPVISPKAICKLPSHFPDLAALVAAIALRGNDLIEASIAVQPVISDVFAALRATSHVAHVGLSGSGATCFGFYATLEAAYAASDVIAASKPSWWRWTGTLL